MLKTINKIIVGSCVLGLSVLLSNNCTTTTDVKTEPELLEDAVPDTIGEPAFTMKPYHHAMSEEMRKSFEKADEIIIGVYTENYVDKQYGQGYYFDNFRIFDKAALSWGDEMNILLPILPHNVNPEIISYEEFKTLSDLDMVGICWDPYEQTRYLYLVAGVPSLVFIEQIIDEANQSSHRNLVDVYPVTRECIAKEVFDLMIRDFVLK